MLIPVPGCTHLKVLVPDPMPAPPPARPASPTDQRTTARLVRIALEAAFGLRPTQQLSSRLFDAGVRIHVTARLRATRATRAAQRAGQRPRDHPRSTTPLRIESLHLRPGGEVFGTASAAGRAHGFTARVEDGRVRSFRVL